MKEHSNVESGHSENTPLLRRKTRDCCLGCSKRWLFVLLGFFGFVNAYNMRSNLSIAMVAMVRTHDQTDDNEESIACPELLKPETNSSSSYIEPVGDFDWDITEQSLILGSFFYGYVITQIPGGYFAEKYGAKWLFGIGVFITSVLTLLSPVAAFWGVWPFAILRVLEGLGEGVTYPAMSTMIGQWASKNERSRFATFIYNGATIGNVVSFALSGVISDTLGWPFIFYIFGILGITWTFFWMFLVYETPERHPCITEEEIKHIRHGQDSSGVHKSPSVPWKAILTSIPVWALVFTQFGQSWCFYTLLTELPTYLATVLHYDIKQNGLLSALPYLVQACLAIVASFLADKLRSSGRCRINTIRKWFNSIGFFSPALCLAVVAYVGCHPTTIIILLTIAVGLNGFSHSGFYVTHVDMSPEYAGTLMGLTNCIGNFSGFLAPAYVGFIIKSGATFKNWRIVFLTSTVFYVVAGLVYIFFSSAELQPWGREESAGRRIIDEQDGKIRATTRYKPM